MSRQFLMYTYIFTQRHPWNYTAAQSKSYVVCDQNYITSKTATKCPAATHFGHVRFGTELDPTRRMTEKRDIVVQWVVGMIVQRIPRGNGRFELVLGVHVLFIVIKTRLGLPVLKGNVSATTRSLFRLFFLFRVVGLFDGTDNHKVFH